MAPAATLLLSGLFRKGPALLGVRHFSCTARLSSEYSNEPFHVLPGRKHNWVSADDAVRIVNSNDRVFVHGVAATPTVLLKSLGQHAKENNLRNIQLYHIHLEGPAVWAEPEYDGIIRSNCMFISANLRKAVNAGRSDCISVFLCETPALFRRRIIELDVALIQCSPPDSKGYCSLGTSVDCTRAALLNAKYIIGLANPNFPRSLGDGIIHSSHFNVMVYGDYELPELKKHTLSPEETTIGKLVAENLVENGATLQMGIGAIPDATLAAMKGHRDLGVHTEMFSDGIVDLVESAAITNAHKFSHPGKLVSSFCIGTKRLYDFLHDNPSIFMGDVSWVNDTDVIRRNPKVTAINSAIEIDLTGQVCADSIGSRMYSGVGGQIDFIRGASLCENGKGKPIIALPSITNKGQSKIVPFLKQGAGVVTTRAHVHYVVTEYGIADLFGQTFRQRAYKLIRIAHPDHRAALEKAAFERLHCMPSAD